MTCKDNIHWRQAGESVNNHSEMRRSVRKYAIHHRFLAMIGLTVVATMVLLACKSETLSGSQRLARDAQAQADIAQTRTRLNAGRPPDNELLTRLRRLNLTYGDVDEIRQLLLQVELLVQDWDGAARLLEAQSEARRSRADQKLLALLYLKLGRFNDAVAFLTRVTSGAAQDFELDLMLARAMFQSGDRTGAGQILDRHWNEMVAARRLDEMVLRALIYFYAGDNGKALDVLQAVVKMDGDFVPANNALSRVYDALGDGQRSELYRRRTELSHTSLAEREAERMRIAALKYGLEEALSSQQYEICIADANQLLGVSDPATRKQVLLYLSRCLEGIGNHQQSVAALEQANAIK